MLDRITDRNHQNGDDWESGDFTFRPKRFEDFIGQDKVKERLKIAIEAAKSRGEVIEHVLLSGPQGLGKSTLANIIAHEMGGNIKTTVGPILMMKADLAAILTNLQRGDILFIDEIHRTKKEIQEMLYPAMEDYRLDIIIGQGPSARTVPIPLPKFVLIGATTRMGQLSAPFRDRFGITLRLDFYEIEQLKEIIRRDTALLKIEIEDGADEIIASRSRGTPRVAKRMLRRVRDYAKVKGDGRITEKIAEESLKFYEVDELGLEDMDRKILRTIIEKFDGGPVGLETIAVSMSEEDCTIEDAHEPYLIQAGLLKRTRLGRVATKLAYEHLGLKPPPRQQDLWDFVDES
ncbi:TPA: Holliday junction branch migration DNA helicase RuvB [Candidatus Poribacteria bacterium]|nr:Holliday junction branch migration DNA helicase RuvB [Candidatus Poribacteria bacterium]